MATKKSKMNILEKVVNLAYMPMEALTDYIREPIKKWDHNREIEKERLTINEEVDANIRGKKAEVDLEIKKEKFKINAKVDASIREKTTEVDLAIKKETEIKRILVEIDEMQKDKEFERMKAVSDAVMKYQQELTKLNVAAINSIGHMQLDLREKAQTLIYDKTIKYKEIQDLAIEEAARDLQRIENNFSDNQAAKKILINAVDKRLANIIDTAHNFLIELNADIKLLNHNISLLAEQGQIFIEKHLDKFHVVAPPVKGSKYIGRDTKEID